MTNTSDALSYIMSELEKVTPDDDKLFTAIAQLVQQAYEQGLEEGAEQGYDNGYDVGHSEGYDDAMADTENK